MAIKWSVGKILELFCPFSVWQYFPQFFGVSPYTGIYSTYCEVHQLYASLRSNKLPEMYWLQLSGSNVVAGAKIKSGLRYSTYVHN